MSSFTIFTGGSVVIRKWASHSLRISLAGWCLGSVVFIYAYSGTLTSFMTFPKSYPIVNSLEELANSSELEAVTWKSHFFESILLVNL